MKTAGSSVSSGPDQDRIISDANHCDIFTDCVHHSKCPYYLKQSEKLKTVSRDTIDFTRMRNELRQLICNKKERKVCCEEPDTFSSTTRPSPRPTPGNENSEIIRRTTRQTTTRKIFTTTTLRTTTAGQWSSWSQCSVTCGVGKQRRSRSDGIYQIQDCNFSSCPIRTTTRSPFIPTRSSTRSPYIPTRSPTRSPYVPTRSPTTKPKRRNNNNTPAPCLCDQLNDWFVNWAKDTFKI